MQDRGRLGVALFGFIWIVWALTIPMADGPSQAWGAESAGSAPLREVTVADLHAALDRLAVDVQQKIDDDIEATASAFWYVYDVERARRAADVFGAGLAAINLFISTIAQSSNLRDIAARLSQAAESGNWLSLSAYVVSNGAALRARC